MIRGTLIGESLRPGTRLDLGAVRSVTVGRHDLGPGAGPDQPTRWTHIDFELADTDGDRFAGTLADALLAQGGWYCDFRDGDDHVVVFAGAVFRYRVGDAEGRARATEHGLRVGVPPAQLDWPD